MKLSWLAWESDQSNGYAHVAHKMRLGLAQRPDIEFVSSYVRGWDLLVAVCTPTSWIIGESPRKRHDVVYHTMFEAMPLPTGWVENMNDAGLIWVPSTWCRDQFQEQGVKTPIMVAGYGVDHKIYYPTDRSGRDGPMKYVVWADTIPTRKNVLLAIQAFLKADIKDAVLEVKLHDMAGIDDGTSSQRFFFNGKECENVLLHVGNWDRKRLIEWLHGADCALYLSGGEGFGLMPLEAAATGLTSIVANNSGMTEFVRPDSYLLVDTVGKVPCVAYNIGYGEKFEVYQPSLEQTIEHIRWAYWNRESMYEMGKRAQQQSLLWNWERAIDLAHQGLSAYMDLSMHPKALQIGD